MRLALTILLVVLAARPVRADQGDAGLVYGVVSSELSMVTFGGLVATEVVPNDGLGFGLAMTTALLVPVGLGFAAHVGEWRTEPLHAIHGAAWSGAGLFLLGALIDGRRDEPWGLRRGPVAWAMGAAGAIAGGLVGSQVRGRRGGTGVWLAAAPLGFVAGGLILGGALVLAGGIDGDAASGQLALGATLGVMVGVGGATSYVLRRPRLAPTVTTGVLDRRGTIFAIGGAF